jgi:hypothetical protein
VLYGLYSFAPESPNNLSFNVQSLPSDLLLYPNPADTYTILDFKVANTTNLRIYLYNNLGQLISNYELGRYTEGQYQQIISLEQYDKGIYFMEVRQDETLLARNKLVIN